MNLFSNKKADEISHLQGAINLLLPEMIAVD